MAIEIGSTGIDSLGLHIDDGPVATAIYNKSELVWVRMNGYETIESLVELIGELAQDRGERAHLQIACQTIQRYIMERQQFNKLLNILVVYWQIFFATLVWIDTYETNKQS